MPLAESMVHISTEMIFHFELRFLVLDMHAWRTAKGSGIPSSFMGKYLYFYGNGEEGECGTGHLHSVSIVHVEGERSL